LRPLKQLSDATRLIGESDLNRRLEVGGPDEVSELTQRFNDMLERLMPLSRRNADWWMTQGTSCEHH